MPAPRQVLADIHDMGLDPTKPHGHIKASGRLAHVAHKAEDVLVPQVTQPVVQSVVEVKEPEPKVEHKQEEQAEQAMSEAQEDSHEEVVEHSDDTGVHNDEHVVLDTNSDNTGNES